LKGKSASHYTGFAVAALFYLWFAIDLHGKSAKKAGMSPAVNFLAWNRKRVKLAARPKPVGVGYHLTCR
jgi:hypothetical protein